LPKQNMPEKELSNILNLILYISSKKCLKNKKKRL